MILGKLVFNVSIYLFTIPFFSSNKNCQVYVSVQELQQNKWRVLTLVTTTWWDILRQNYRGPSPRSQILHKYIYRNISTEGWIAELFSTVFYVLLLED